MGRLGKGSRKNYANIQNSQNQTERAVSAKPQGRVHRTSSDTKGEISVSYAE